MNSTFDINAHFQKPERDQYGPWQRTYFEYPVR